MSRDTWPMCPCLPRNRTVERTGTAPAVITGAAHSTGVRDRAYTGHASGPSVQPHSTVMSSKSSFFVTLAYYLNPLDGRYEDLGRGNRRVNIFKDLTAGLIVAMVAIPLAMGFAMASGLRPEQGIVGGAVAGLLGALFGG